MGKPFDFVRLTEDGFITELVADRTVRVFSAHRRALLKTRYGPGVVEPDVREWAKRRAPITGFQVWVRIPFFMVIRIDADLGEEVRRYAYIFLPNTFPFVADVVRVGRLAFAPKFPEPGEEIDLAYGDFRPNPYMAAMVSALAEIPMEALEIMTGHAYGILLRILGDHPDLRRR